jgi:hypothetical protein
MYIGMKNPLLVTSTDPKQEYTFKVVGGVILNEQKNHEFDLVPLDRIVVLYIVSLKGEMLDRMDFVSVDVIPPIVELVFNSKKLKYEELIYRSCLSRLKLKIYGDTTLKNDLIELPVYSIGKIEVIHNRGRKTISQSNSISALNTIATKVDSGDEVIIYISSYTYVNALNNIIENRTSKMYRLKIK